MFEVGKWYPVRQQAIKRHGGQRRYVVGSLPDGSKLVVADEVGNITHRFLDGRHSKDRLSDSDLVQPPRTFETEVEVVAIDRGCGDIRLVAAQKHPLGSMWLPTVVARRIITVQLTEGEGV